MAEAAGGIDAYSAIAELLHKKEVIFYVVFRERVNVVLGGRSQAQNPSLFPFHEIGHREKEK